MGDGEALDTFFRRAAQDLERSLHHWHSHWMIFDELLRVDNPRRARISRMHSLYRERHR